MSFARRTTNDIGDPQDPCPHQLRTYEDGRAALHGCARQAQIGCLPLTGGHGGQMRSASTNGGPGQRRLIPVAGFPRLSRFTDDSTVFSGFSRFSGKHPGGPQGLSPVHPQGPQSTGSGEDLQMPTAQAHASGEIGDIGIGPALQPLGDYGRGDPFTHAFDAGHTEANRKIGVHVQGAQRVRRWTQRLPA